MSGICYGYMRVSSADQNEIRQRVELEKWGIAKKNLYFDQLSGRNFDRPEYQKLKKKLREGDVLVVKSIDRLGRSYLDIQEEWRQIIKEIRADIVILDMPLLDTRNQRDLIGTLISDIVLQLLSYVAQSERENIRQRQAEGIAAARARGAHLGRFPAPDPEGFIEQYENWLHGKLTMQAAASSLGLKRHQFEWLVRRRRRAEEEQKKTNNREEDREQESEC